MRLHSSLSFFASEEELYSKNGTDENQVFPKIADLRGRKENETLRQKAVSALDCGVLNPQGGSIRQRSKKNYTSLEPEIHSPEPDIDTITTAQ